VVREVDVDIVRRVVGAVPRQLDAFTADLQGPVVGESLFRRGFGRVIVPQQQPPGLLVPDPDHVGAEQRGGTGVVRVVVGVNQVGHPVAHPLGGGDVVHGPLQVVADGRRRVEQHHAVRGGQERRVVVTVGDPVEVPLDASDVVALVVDRRTERGSRNRRVIRQQGRTGRA
jgi:hypothetical protein